MNALWRSLALTVLAGFFLAGDASAQTAAGLAERVTSVHSDAPAPILEANRVRFKPG